MPVKVISTIAKDDNVPFTLSPFQSHSIDSVLDLSKLQLLSVKPSAEAILTFGLITFHIFTS